MELPKRKSPRLPGYDYNSGGTYFITICTQNRECLLSQIVGDDAHGVPKSCLTDMGKIVEKYILSGNRLDRITVDKYVIMPNHVHLLLIVDDMPDGPPRATAPTQASIPSFISAWKRLSQKEIGKKIFQRSYHDHIVRNEKDYLRIWQYMENNPKQWEMDCFYVKEKTDVFIHR